MSVPTGTFGGPLWLGKSHRTRDGGTRPLRTKGFDTKEHKRNMHHPQEQEPPRPRAGELGAKGTFTATGRSAVPVGGTATGSDCRAMKGETTAIFLQNPVRSNSGLLNAGVKDEGNNLDGVKPAKGATSDLYFSEGGHHCKIFGKWFGKPNVEAKDPPQHDPFGNAKLCLSLIHI